MENVTDSILRLLASRIRNIPDFPTTGIQFKDITPLLRDRDTLELTSQMLARPYRGDKVDYVVGLESRGFLFGTNLAQDLHAGFVPIRKPGKLPAETHEVSYELEYGTDTFEIHADSIPAGSRVVIHDDLIATGGSAKAATELVARLGADVGGYSFILELEELKGRDQLPEDIPFEVLVSL